MELLPVTGEPVPVPYPGRMVHLPLRHSAGYPVCSLHPRSVATQHDAIAADGLPETVVASSGPPGHSPIGQDETLVAARRGSHADDQRSVDDLLGLAAGPSSEHGS